MAPEEHLRLTYGLYTLAYIHMCILTPTYVTPPPTHTHPRTHTKMGGDNTKICSSLWLLSRSGSCTFFKEKEYTYLGCMTILIFIWIYFFYPRNEQDLLPSSTLTVGIWNQGPGRLHKGKHSLCKPQDSSSNPQTPVKAGHRPPVIPLLGGRDRRILGVCWSVSRAKMVSFRLSETLPKKWGDMTEERHPKVNLWLPTGICIGQPPVYTPYTCTQNTSLKISKSAMREK